MKIDSTAEPIVEGAGPEWMRGRPFPTFAELDAALKAYIRFYNHHRLHAGIDYHTPEEYERLVS